MAYDFTWFEQILGQWDITLSDKQRDQFLTYYEMLIEKNKVMNLTAIREPKEVATLHFLDSLALLRAESFAGKRVIDVGCGAGFGGALQQ